MLRGFSALEERNPVLLSLSSEPGVLSLALRHAPWTHPQWTHPQPRSIWPGSHRDRQVTGVTPYLTFFESGTRPQNHPPRNVRPKISCGTVGLRPFRGGSDLKKRNHAAFTQPCFFRPGTPHPSRQLNPRSVFSRASSQLKLAAARRPFSASHRPALRRALFDFSAVDEILGTEPVLSLLRARRASDRKRSRPRPGFRTRPAESLDRYFGCDPLQRRLSSKRTDAPQAAESARKGRPGL